ncbi:MAG: cupredoxin domain-containing protein [Chloroflexi bacterium]|nr:cupredoxin domain-containing protein [Chloroflexota bacterium]
MKSHTRNKPQVRNHPSTRTRALAFAAIVIVVLGAAGYLLVTALSPRTLPPSENTLDVSVAMNGFSTNEIRLKVGQPVTIRVTSLDNSHHTDGGGQHQWAVDEFGVSVIAPPLGSNFITFKPDKTGTFTFYCDICCGGRANPTMQGTLIVEA